MNDNDNMNEWCEYEDINFVGVEYDNEADICCCGKPLTQECYEHMAKGY